jgi:WD40 repeat protein
VKKFQSHSKRITCIDISVDNTLLASGSCDSTARIWNLETGKLVGGPFHSIDWVGAVQFLRLNRLKETRSQVRDGEVA